jgi:hypothetical protein
MAEDSVVAKGCPGTERHASGSLSFPLERLPDARDSLIRTSLPKKTTDVTPIDARIDLGLTVSPDGKYLLFTKIDYIGADLMLVEKFR